MLSCRPQKAAVQKSPAVPVPAECVLPSPAVAADCGTTDPLDEQGLNQRRGDSLCPSPLLPFASCHHFLYCTYRQTGMHICSYMPVLL